MAGIRSASRYAKALLNLAVENGDLEKVYADMKLIKSTCQENPNLSIILKSPIIRSDKKISILKEIFKSKTNPLTLLFIELLSRKGREPMLEPVAAEFIAQYKVNKKILSAIVITADGLDDTLRKKVYELVKKGNQNEVELVEKVNRDLIGGFVLRVGDNQVDASIMRQIKNLRRGFAENPFIKEY